MSEGSIMADTSVRPPQSKTTYVVERLRQDIAAGAIVPGTPLRQTEIAARYGVSPTPVREALRRLETAGIIVYSPNRGATVRDLEPTAAHDLYLLRAELEGFATELGTSRQDDTLVPTLNDLQQELETLEPTEHAAEMYRINRRLHFAIFEAGSHVVARQIDSVWEMFAPVVTIWGYPQIAEALLHDHRSIIETIAAGDSKLARQQMLEHVLNAARLRTQYVQ